MFVSLKSLLHDDYYDKKFNVLLRYNKYAVFMLKENGLTPEIKHDYLKALLDDKVHDDFYKRFKRVRYYLHALNIFVFQKYHLHKALASACNAEDVYEKEPTYEVNAANLIEVYRPQLRDTCKSKYSVGRDGLLASIGGVFGDIAGSRYEFYSGDRSVITFESAVSKHSRITDDSVLLLATLAATNTSSESSYAETYRKFYNQYPSAGYGPGFVRWALEDIGPYGSFGNGSAMRVAPVGELIDDIDDVIRHAIASAECTHNHPEGIKGAVVTAVCIWMSRYGYSKNDILSYVKKHYSTQNLIKDYNMDELRSCIQGGYAVTCQFSVPAAITCFIESDTYEDCIVNALSFEGDSDTIACISGAIAAAYYGHLSENIITIVSEKLPLELKQLLFKNNHNNPAYSKIEDYRRAYAERDYV